MNIKSTRNIVIALLVLVLGGCSGGTGGTGASPATSVVSSGVMTKGSVIVNGVQFEDTAANIIIDDTPKTALNLKDGMVVQVVGTVSADGVNGTAQQVEVQIEVRGLVSSVDAAANPQRFVVLGQTVIVDDLTLYSNLSGFGAITAGTTVVEVHGLRDTTGAIRASRVEGSLDSQPDGTGMTNPLVDEIRGVVSNLSGSVFKIGNQVVNAAGATIAPSGASFGNRSVVEVHCTARPNCVVNGEFLASLVEVESMEDASFQPGQNQRFEVEGLVSGFSTGNTEFFVAGVPVTISGSTRFEGGISTDLVDNTKVEAEGVWNGTSLAASKIEFKRSVVRLQGTVSAPGTSTFTLNVAGRPVSIETDSFTSGSVPPAGPDCVQVRGQRKAGGGVVVTAGEIRSNNCGNSNRPVMQAPVEAELPESTITLLGFSLDVSSPTDITNQWVDINNQGITQTAFFNAVVPANPGPPAVAGTLVKVIFNNDGTDTVRQVEIED